MIDWTRAQRRLAIAGYNPGAIDGAPGPNTYDALLAFAASRPRDQVDDGLAAMAARHFTEYGMTTVARVAEFVAQITNETGGFRSFSENLYYSTAARIRANWPTRFKSVAAAEPYTRAPEKLANFVYARPNEGNTHPGDGWRYRGRGALQLTFRNNYRRFGELIGLDLVADPTLAAEPGVSLLIALAFFREGKVNDWVDQGDFRAARGITNAGTPRPKREPIGLEEVARLRRRLINLLA